MTERTFGEVRCNAGNHGAAPFRGPAACEDDDGYLSASEITQLKLCANWVILSACNAAAGDAEGTQALSGLARAFIYAFGQCYIATPHSTI